MSTQHLERAFEDELCAHLEANGWLYSADDTGYDRQRALFPEDVFAWLEDTQPDELSKKVKPAASPDAQAKARDGILNRLVQVLDKGQQGSGGALHVLRNGFSDTPARFQMMQKRPESGVNAALLDRYAKNQVRIMRQVHYSTKNNNSIDLVCFVNGIPVATIEVKTDFTQTVDDAKKQYWDDRQPAGEPLLGFGTRALVHFAVSNDEVWMTTKLAGASTRFLPFNRGTEDGHAGNRLDEDGGSATTYLWRDVLQRDSWLDILGKFIHYETEKIKDEHGREATRHNLIFPRYHQLEAVTRLVDHAQHHGSGHSYLVQHSAGSGKTRTIAWTAHRLATLHDRNNDKVFDTVIVVTDRTVLDTQLQEAIRQLEPKSGMVQTIDKTSVRRMRVVDPTKEKRSKSTLLGKTLSSGKLITVVTLQTFPFVLETIRDDPAMKGRRFAIIADEAHSSMTGESTRKLREAMASLVEAGAGDDLGEIPEEGSDEPVDASDMVAAIPSAANTPNVSYLGFTATPKQKTLQTFGTEQPDGSYRAFHTYSMAQAIEEEFIVDVLQNYISYKTAYKLAQDAKSGCVRVQAPDEEGRLVDESAATRGVVRWVKLHPTNITQKVAIIVDHFEDQVKYWLGGQAKAMVVTDSRIAAVRYKKAMDDYIAKKGYPDVTSLVAFSGEVVVTEKDLQGYEGEDAGVALDDRYTESSMNPDAGDLREAFDTPEYRVMIVADKFQTGFDQPKLCAMYVDKKLDGIAAVQTLSRLNRYVPGKKTVVLDFVNKPDTILDAFKEYYEEAVLQEGTDPNLVHDLGAKLDHAGIYDQEDVDATVVAFLSKRGNNALNGALGPVRQRFRDQWSKASAADDKSKIDALETFRKDISSYVKLYDFLSQVVDYGDTEVEKRSIFLRLLAMRLGRPGSAPPSFDLADVQLVGLMQVEKGRHALDLKTGEAKELKPIKGVGTRGPRDPHWVLLETIISRLNEQFAGEDFRDDQVQSWTESLVAAMASNDELRGQAEVNSEAQFLASPTLRDALLLAVDETNDAHTRMTRLFNEKGSIEQAVLELLGRLVYMQLGARGEDRDEPDEQAS